MTVDTNATADLALPDGALPWEADDSLDELKQSEIPTPRLRVVGKDAQFENSDTSERYDSLEVVILGLVRSRVFWPDEVEEDGQPFCRSLDAKTGFPNVDDDLPVKKQFPWNKSNFERAELPLLENVQPVAPCAECIFAQWDNAADKPAPCSEQFNLPVFYKDSYDNWSPAILTFQRSGAKATTRYLGAIKAAKQAPFMYYTTIELEPRSRGSVDYAVPRYSKGEMTDPGENNENWLEFHKVFTEIRDFMRRPRIRHHDDADDGTAPSRPEPQDERPAPQPKATPAAQAAEDVIDVEFADTDTDDDNLF